MPTLSLFRHAKSAWDNPGLSDFDRPLAPRGEKAAPRMGQFMAREGLVPDIVLCSTAVRAIRTVELARAEWKQESGLRFEETLYMAGPERMLGFLRDLPDTYDHAMIVAHNPGMQALATSLASHGDALGLAKMGEKFPTAALAVIDFNDSWKDIGPGKGKLRMFVTPRNVS